MPIYTRTGDKGQTMLFTGRCVQKDSPYMEALGNVDECGSCLGLALSQMPQQEELEGIREQVIHIQHALFDLGAAVATPPSDGSSTKLEKTRFDAEAVRDLERWIDDMAGQLPPLTTFILAGGHSAGAQLHLARAICRRAERSLIPLLYQEEVENSILIYLNRLSDYLFMAARFVNHAVKEPETAWVKHHTM